MLAKQRYQFENSFPDEKISPLSLLCALGAKIQTIKICYSADPSALTQIDAVHGTPLHYASAYHADSSVMELLLYQLRKRCYFVDENNKDMLVHFSTQYRASEKNLMKLAYLNSLPLLMTDSEGNTPLHLAVANSSVHSLQVLQLLIEHSSTVLCSKKNFAGATPLHLALFVGAPFKVIQTLVEAHEMTLRIMDNKGRLPLHVAAKEGATLKTFVCMVRKYREALNIEDNLGRIPYEVAKKHNRDTQVQLLLSTQCITTTL